MSFFLSCCALVAQRGVWRVDFTHGRQKRVGLTGIIRGEGGVKKEVSSASLSSVPPSPSPLLGLLLRRQQRGADAQLLQLLHQVPVLVHLEQDVAAAHELTAEVQLRDRGPVGEELDSCGKEPTLRSGLTEALYSQVPAECVYSRDNEVHLVLSVRFSRLS